MKTTATPRWDRELSLACGLHQLTSRLPPSMAGPRLPSSSNFRPATNPIVNPVISGKRTKLR